MARIPDAQVSFTDADGDEIKLTAERQGTRGRVSLFHNGNFFGNFVTKVVYTTGDMKLYVNGHEATIQLKKGGEDIIDEIEKVCDTGLAVFSKGESIDAAAELAKVKQKNLEESIEAMEAEGVSKELIEKAVSKHSKDVTKRKKVPEETLTALLEMGIPETRAIRALALSDGTTVELAISWLEKHQEDPNIDKPIEDYLKPEFTKPLTAEEKAAKAKELQSVLEQKKAEKAAADKEYQRQLEKARRKDGKDKAEWKEEYEKKKRMDAYEERRREKERDKLAKEALRKQIQEERAAKGWAPLPEAEEKDGKDAGGELKMTAKEFFESQKAAAAKPDDDWDPMRLNTPQAVEPAKPQPLPAHGDLPLPGVSLTDSDLVKAVAKVSALPGSLKILKAYVGNIVNEPFNPKFRTIKTTNNAFVRNIAPHPDAVTVLFLLGFRPLGEVLNITSIHLPTAASLLKILEGISA